MDDDDSYANYGSSEDVYGVGAAAQSSTPPHSVYSGADEYYEEARFENEYNVYERVGGQILGDVDVDLRDPLQRFTQFTKTVAHEMINQGFIGLKKPDVRYIIEQIQYIPNSKYKNPTAFVLGFWVTKNSNTGTGIIDSYNFV